MDLVFCCEEVFLRYKNNYYPSFASYNMELWNRYLSIFPHITIVARVKDVDYEPENLLDSKKISFICLPPYRGILGNLKVSILGLKRFITPFLKAECCYILRVPGHVGSVLSKILKKRNIPYSIEVVGDPWDVMESIGGRLAFILKRLGRFNLLNIVAGSTNSLYVTRHTLQNKYPSPKNSNVFGVSDVIISTDFLVDNSRKFPETKPFKLLAVGSLAQLYKSPDVVVEALSILAQRGINIKMTWLGDGKYKDQMESMAKDYGVDEMISFKGNVDRKAVEHHLESADLFIHVSRTEGLPRAIVEAMAKALPVIGTQVGGIPELLTNDCLISPNNAEALADKIELFLSDSKFYETISSRNLKEAMSYEDSKLRVLRNEFFHKAININLIR